MAQMNNIHYLLGLIFCTKNRMSCSLAIEYPQMIPANRLSILHLSIACFELIAAHTSWNFWKLSLQCVLSVFQSSPSLSGSVRSDLVHRMGLDLLIPTSTVQSTLTNSTIQENVSCAETTTLTNPFLPSSINGVHEVGNVRENITVCSQCHHVGPLWDRLTTWTPRYCL